MVKKHLLIFSGLSVFLLLVIAFAITNNKNEYDLSNLNEPNMCEYREELSYKNLPSECLFVLNDTYCICKDISDLNVNSSEQYPDAKETIYLYNSEEGKYKKILEYPLGYSTFGYVMSKNNIFWIEHYVDRKERNSGGWQIRKYSLDTSEIITVDEGQFNDFQRFAYDDISFSDPMMLFPVNIDISNDILVYNRVIEKDEILNTQIIAYDINKEKLEIVTQGKDHVNDYVFDVSISENYIVYNKYHEKNIDYNLRSTTYKYCDVYVYNLENGKTEQLSKNDFFINLELSNKKVAAVRIPEREKDQDVFARMQLIIFDIEKKTGSIVLNHKSPIYENRNDLTIGNPKFIKKYLVWQDNALQNHMNIYNYQTNMFLEIPEKNSFNDTAIIDAIDNSLVVLEVDEDGSDNMYKVNLK